MRWSMEIKELQPQPVLRIQSRVAPQRLDEFLMEAFTRLFPFLASLGEHPAGPPFIVYYDSVAQGGIDVEVCIPTLTVLPVPPDDDDIVPAELPGGDFATTVHVGPSDNIGEAYRALVLWLTDNGYRLTGPCREVHIASFDTGDEPPEDVTEILFPVSRAA